MSEKGTQLHEAEREINLSSGKAQRKNGKNEEKYVIISSFGVRARTKRGMCINRDSCFESIISLLLHVLELFNDNKFSALVGLLI